MDESRRETGQPETLHGDKKKTPSPASSGRSSSRPRSTSVSPVRTSKRSASPSGRSTSHCDALLEKSVHTPSDSERSSVSEKSWAGKLASEVHESDLVANRADRAKSEA